MAQGEDYFEWNVSQMILCWIYQKRSDSGNILELRRGSFFTLRSNVVFSGLLLVLLVVAIKVQWCDSRVGMQSKDGGCRSWARQRCKVVGPKPTDERVARASVSQCVTCSVVVRTCGGGCSDFVTYSCYNTCFAVSTWRWPRHSQ